jgi:hypothetical protein
MVAVVGLIVTPVTATAVLATVTEVVAVNWPFTVTVIVANPAETAVTSPEELTVATEGLLEDQFVLEADALEGETIAVICWVFPIRSVVAVGYAVTPVTAPAGVIVIAMFVASLWKLPVIGPVVPSGYPPEASALSYCPFPFESTNAPMKYEPFGTEVKLKFTDLPNERV